MHAWDVASAVADRIDRLFDTEVVTQEVRTRKFRLTEHVSLTQLRVALMRTILYVVPPETEMPALQSIAAKVSPKRALRIAMLLLMLAWFRGGAKSETGVGTELRAHVRELFILFLEALCFEAQPQEPRKEPGPSKDLLTAWGAFMLDEEQLYVTSEALSGVPEHLRQRVLMRVAEVMCGAGGIAQQDVRILVQDVLRAMSRDTDPGPS